MPSDARRSFNEVFAMTRELRQRHRRAVLFLAVALPVVFVAALLARRAVPVNGAPISKSVRSLHTTIVVGLEITAVA